MTQLISLLLSLCTVFTSPMPHILPTLPTQPVTQEEFADVCLYAAITDTSELSFTYPDGGLDKDEVGKVLEEGHSSFYRTYPEYSMYFRCRSFSLADTKDGQILTLYFSYRGSLTATDLQTSILSAQKVRRQLYSSGLLDESMTQQARARVMMDWVCNNMEYRYEQDNPELSTARCGFQNGYGACAAYTGMYNLLLRADGIDCHGRYGTHADGGEAHEWTVATLDGKQVNIDVTWCDTQPYMVDWYFARSDCQFRQTHSW